MASLGLGTFHASLGTLAADQRVSLGVGERDRRGWYLAQVLSLDPAAGRLKVRCFMDRAADQALEPGQRVVIAAQPRNDALVAAPMDVEESTGGAEALVTLRIAGAWQREDERRHQVRVPLAIPIARARRWQAGAWRDLHATLTDLSSRGLGVSVDTPVRVGDRLSLTIPLEDGQPDWRVIVEMRHVRASRGVDGLWHAGGLLRNISPAEHERVIRFIFAELRTRRG